MPALGNALDFSKYEARNIRAHQLGAAPSSPVTGQLYYNTADNTLYWWDGTTWISGRGGVTPDATTSSKGIVQLAGDLAGTAASPQIAPLAVTDAEVAAANKDGAVATPSMRTLGTGANQAAPGNDSRFGAASPPNGAAGGDLSGTYPNPAIAAGVIIDTDFATAHRDGIAATQSIRSLGSGAQQAMPGNRTLDAINAAVGNVNLGGQRIVSLQTPPTSPSDAASKQYVDDQMSNVAQGLDAKASVRVASTATVVLTAPGAAIDGITMAAGDRVLLKNQTAPAENGLWVWNGAAVAMTRTTDADAWAELPSAYVWVEVGTVNADTGWVCTSDAGGTIGTTAVTWVQFSSAGAASAGAGLTKTGNTFDVGAGTGISVAADTVGLVVPVSVANGGTGGTTPAAARTAIAAAGYYSSATHGASTTISITAATHGLRATRGIQVQVQDEATGAVEFPDVVVAASGDVTVTYGASVTANSKRVTLVG